MKKGYFITFEGPDGSGKTTVCNAVYQRLKDMGYDVVHTREPGGIEIAEKIRDIILDPQNVMMDAKTEALLYAASRRQHLVEKVIPSIEAGKVVICERFVDSSLAYQGYGRELGFDEVLSINKFAIGDYFPDMTVYLDVDEKTGLERIKDRAFKDRLDQESIDFHHRVNEGYQKVIDVFKDRVSIVDASKPLDSVIEDALSRVKELIDD
ncbi:MAG: dTMP kinase [Erysipelotrichaceae bacterium]|nr:dTMP kinase [Erysipelotrichaceae bacterium]